MALGAPVGIGHRRADADRWGRKPTIIGASAVAIVFGIALPV